jgi:hypothetical protein
MESQNSAVEDFKAPEDLTPVTKLALRDGAIALAALSLWAAGDTWYVTSGLGLAALLSVLDGFFVGVVVSALAHEWGHFAGARLNGGVAPTTRFSSFFPLFVYDMEHSDARAFRGMSVGGNIGHWLVVLVLTVFLPLDGPGRIALVSAAFGYACFASTTEFPIIQRAYSGASPVESFAGLTAEKLRRNQWIGAAAAVGLFIVL